MMGKRKEEDSMDDNAEAGNVNDMEDKDAPLAKKSKTNKGNTKATKPTKDDAEKKVHSLSNKKRAQLNEFKGFHYADIREYYEEKGSGEWKPGKKGITLNKAELIALKNVIDELIEGFPDDAK